MIKKLENFLNSQYYLLTLALLTFLFWFINIDSFGPNPYFDSLELIGISVFVLFMALCLVLYKRTIYTLPIVISSIFMLSNQNMGMTTLNELWIFYVVLGVVAIAFIYHFIRFKVKLTFGFLGIPLILVALTYILSISGYFLDQKPFEFSVIFISLMGFIYLLVYMFFRSTNDGSYTKYLFKFFYYMSYVVILQTFVMLIYYFIDHAHMGSFTEILSQGIEERFGYIKNGFFVRLNVGWGLGNNIGGILAFFLPIHMYELFKSKSIKTLILNALGFILVLITIILTTSRGAYLGVLAFGILFIIGFIKYAPFDYKKYKKVLIRIGLLLLPLLVLVIIFGVDFMISFMQKSSFLNGREVDWVDAWNYFLEHPIFGKSWYSDTWELDSFRSYHNTILHTLATMGIVGLLGFIYFQFNIVKLVIKNFHFESFVILSMFIVTHVHGLVDNTYYAPLHMIPLLILLGSLETFNSSSTKLIES